MDDLADWLTQIWDEQETLAKDAALMSGWDGFGESRIASGSEWSASYHVVKRKRAEGEPIESRKGRELADCGNLNLERAAFIAANDPTSVLARIAADRQILARCLKVLAVEGWEYSDAPELAEATIRDLAQPYSDREGFRDEWRVSS